MNLIEETAQKLYELTKDRPMFLHMDAIGFFNFGENEGQNIEEIIDNKLKKFNEALLLAQDLGANILIPTFSYSIENGKLNYDVVNSKSEVGAATEFFRKLNIEKRTNDPLFSYLLFSNNKELREDLKIKNFDTFGEGSIIDKVFKMDGFIASIGDVIWRTTEAHYLEKKIKVPYRFDKNFEGTIVDINKNTYNIKTIFFCRDLNINLQADFKPIINSLRDKKMVQQCNIQNFNIEFFSIKSLYKIMKIKFEKEPLYFIREENEN